MFSLLVAVLSIVAQIQNAVTQLLNRSPVNRAVFAYTASGTWTCPQGVTKVEVTVVGGGENGGTNTGAPGGPGGEVKREIVTVTPGTAYPITVGARSSNSSAFGITSLGGGGNNGGAGGFSGNGAVPGGPGGPGRFGYGGGGGGGGAGNSSAISGGPGGAGAGRGATGAGSGATSATGYGAGGGGGTSGNAMLGFQGLVTIEPVG